MTTLRLRVTAVAVAIVSTLTAFVPAQAFQVPVPSGISTASPVTDVQYRRDWRRDRPGWYHGHRGYRERRPGYRYYNGFWFPLAAFGAGALIGGAIQSGRPASGHVAWCESRYRTYRASDNTYVASGGIRRTCISPR